MKNNLFIFMMGFMLCCQTEVKAEQTEDPIAYTVVRDGTATLYYDLERWNRLGTIYEGFPEGKYTTSLGMGWIAIYGGWTEADFQYFVIDPSFANYKDLTSTAYWFCDRSSLLSITGMEYLNTENVTTMDGMFSGCSSLTSLDVSHLNTSKVISMGAGRDTEGHRIGMFYCCSSLTSLDVSNFNTENVTTMLSMFEGCSSLTSLDISNFNTKNVTSMGYMFSRCSGLTSLNVSNFNTENVTYMTSMFSGCSSLTTLDVSNFNTGKVEYMRSMFSGCSGLTTLDVSNFNTENVTYMDEMFFGCNGLTSLDLSNFNTENVKSMDKIFYGCNGLSALDLSSFNTFTLYSAREMFAQCNKLVKITTGEYFVVDNIDNNKHYDMFKGCTSLVGQYGTVYDPNFVDRTRAYVGEGGYLWGVPATLVRAYAVYNNNTVTFYYDENKGNRPGNIDDLYNTGDKAWKQMGNIEKVVFDPSFADFHGRQQINGITFYYCYNLTSIEGLKYLDTSKMTSMSGMFAACENLISVDLAGFNTENVMDMSSMFSSCSRLTSLDLSGFNTANVSNMSGMFAACSSLTTIDLSSFNTANVSDMSDMFSGCSSLTSVDLSGFNTTNVTDMSRMFKECKSLTSLDMSSFNTANVTNMRYMFELCLSLTSLNLGSFNTANVTDMGNMFSGCQSLLSLDVSSFNTANVTNMQSMFRYCNGLTSLDMSSFNTENVTNMEYMFQYCKGLISLDMSSFVTASGLKTRDMFRSCTNLETIYASECWNKNNIDTKTYGDNMFWECKKLIGGAGTVYNSRYTDYKYAQIDRGTNNPGYFTDRNTQPSNSVEETKRIRTGGNYMIYSLFGERLTTPQKGINIINSKKVVLK